MMSQDERNFRFRAQYAKAVPTGSLVPLGLALPVAGVVSEKWPLILFLFLFSDFFWGSFRDIYVQERLVRRQFWMAQIFSIAFAVLAVLVSGVFWVGLVACMVWWSSKYSKQLFVFLKNKWAPEL